MSDRGVRPSLAFSSLGDLLGTGGDGLLGEFEIGDGLFGGVNGLSKTDARLGTGGAFNCDISISGFAGARVREPDVALDAELPGRGGRTRDASGASSESSDDEFELSSVSLISRATDLALGRAKIKFTDISVLHPMQRAMITHRSQDSRFADSSLVKHASQQLQH